MPRLEFHSNNRAFDLYNAYFLAKLSDLAYQPLDQIQPVLETDYTFTRYKAFEVKDTQAFVAANQEVIALVFRGTTSAADWLTNVKFFLVASSLGRVHVGFKEALDVVWKDLYDTVMSWKEKDQNLWVTGHSLGGALATLAVDRFTEENVELVNNLYTFGQPRVGDKAFADNFNTKMKSCSFRLVDDQDIVTKVPLPPLYRHIGIEYFFDNKGVIHKEGIFSSWFRSASEEVYLRSIAIDGAIQYESANPGGIRDHSADYYTKYLYQNFQKQGKSPFVDYINKD